VSLSRRSAFSWSSQVVPDSGRLLSRSRSQLTSRLHWFTASTSFANPAVTIARSLSDTFAGIRPVDVPLFVAAQVVGGLAATFIFSRLNPIDGSSR